MTTTCKHGTILYGTCMACERENAHPVVIDNPAQRVFSHAISKSLNKEINKSFSFVGPPRPPVITPKVNPFHELIHRRPVATKNVRRCPFCLSKPSLDQDFDDMWSVRCINKQCLVSPITKPCSVVSDAIDAWNGERNPA